MWSIKLLCKELVYHGNRLHQYTYCLYTHTAWVFVRCQFNTSTNPQLTDWKVSLLSNCVHWTWSQCTHHCENSHLSFHRTLSQTACVCLCVCVIWLVLFLRQTDCRLLRWDAACFRHTLNMHAFRTHTGLLRCLHRRAIHLSLHQHQ